MMAVGEHMDGFPFPVCNAFTPSVIEGQLCYTFTPSTVRNTDTASNPVLMLLLDDNEDREYSNLIERDDENDNEPATLEEIDEDNKKYNKLGLSCAKLSTAEASYHWPQAS